MRKITTISFIGLTLVAACAPETSACWPRRRCRYVGPVYYQICEPIYEPAAGAMPQRPAHRLTKPVVQSDVLTTSKQTVHRLVTIDDVGWQEKPGEIQPVPEAGAVIGETFNGNDREAAKTSVSGGLLQSNASLSELVARLPATDDFMRHKHVPPISKERKSGRVPEEEHNASVTAYLVATKKETDNDYHLILATTPNGDGPYLTAEVSGLSRLGTPQDKAALAAARGQYRDILSNKMPGARYVILDPPLAVTVIGSLFYDMDHEPGVVGTGDYVPATSWEIHPVTTIALSP
jgi:hypothetical protein